MRTPLYEEHVKLGAKMTEFAGWEMPLQYAGIAHEVEVVRTKVGLFDISHMGEFVICGPNALSLVQHVTTNDASTLDVGAAQYSLLCDESGGVVDDLILYRTDEWAYIPVVNAANADSDFAWIESHNSVDAGLRRWSGVTSVAVQGPMAECLVDLVADHLDVRSLARFGVAEATIADSRCRVARTGYTGEDGFEISTYYCESPDLWVSLLEAGKPFGAEPCGLGARDVLRLEAAYPLYGHELTRETTPVAARLMWVVKPEKGDFIGRDAILRAKQGGEPRTLVGLEAVDRCIPRHGSDVVILKQVQHDAIVGSITSGTFSPTLGKAIALAYIDREFSAVGTEVGVITGGRTCRCRVVPTPFYKRPAHESRQP